MRSIKLFYCHSDGFCSDIPQLHQRCNITFGTSQKYHLLNKYHSHFARISLNEKTRICVSFSLVVEF